MNKELFIASTPHETKVAVVEDDLLAEIHFERENEYTLAGSIYKGRVTRVLPGMQSAFVDIGLERDAFLYVTDFLEEQDESEELEPVNAQPSRPDRQERQERPDRSQFRPREPREQQEVQPHLIEAQPAGEPIVFEGGADDLEDTTEESQAGNETAPANGQERAADDQEGARRWRGRRRRGRGRRGQGFPESKFSNEGRSEAPPAESRPEPRFESRERRPRQDFGPPPGYQPIILPGESISKYRNRPSAAPAPEVHAEEAHVQEVHDERSREDATSVADAGSTEFSAEPQADYTAAPRSADEGVSVMAGVEVEDTTETTTTKHEDQHEETVPVAAAEAVQRHDDERRYEQMNVAAIFGSDEEQVETAQASSADESAPLEVAEHGAPGGTSFAPGAGHVEEEVIEEEETEMAALDAGSDDLDYDEEMEEETLERAAGAPSLDVAAGEGGEGSELEQRADAENGEQAEGEEEEEYDEAEEAHAAAEAEFGTADQAEVRAPSGTAGYQRAGRQQWDRRRGGRGRRGPGGRRGFRREPQRTQMISELLSEGQEILVQIAKEPIGKKGARITSHIALPGRFLVYMPTVNHVGVSRKISSEEERQRLKRIVISERENGHGGFIVRTAADHAPEEELRADIRFLKHLWHEIKARSETSKPPALIYHDLSLVERILRDQVNDNFTAIWVDTEQDYERLIRFVNRFQPALVKRVKLYTKQTPLFEQFGIQEEINKALKSKVWLKSGGYIVINQTEALVAIDVNTGKYVGKTQRLEDTIVKTNVDAIKEIVRQIRLRDLGGIIVIDFIDMDERRNRQRVMQALEEALQHDRAPSKVLQFNDFGLVAITRKRVKQSLERTLGAPCPYCTGTGFAKSPVSVANEIWVEMRKMARDFDHPDIMLRVHPEVAKALKANGSRWIQEMEELTKRNIIVKSDPLLHQEQFDIN